MRAIRRFILSRPIEEFPLNRYCLLSSRTHWIRFPVRTDHFTAGQQHWYSSHAQKRTTARGKHSHHAVFIFPAGITNTSLSDLKGDPDAFHRFTSGRWLWGEHEQLVTRYVKFDMQKLFRLAANAIGSESCVQVEKLSEGQFNKVFLLTMNDGREVIAKLPNPNAGRPHFTTASEVATMNFVHEPSF